MPSTVIDAIGLVILILQGTLIIFFVLRWNWVGVILGAITSEVGFILMDLVTWFDPRTAWTDEIYEAWYYVWIIGLIYSLVILGCKFSVK